MALPEWTSRRLMINSPSSERGARLFDNSSVAMVRFRLFSSSTAKSLAASLSKAACSSNAAFSAAATAEE